MEKCASCVDESSKCLQCRGGNRTSLAPECACLDGYYTPLYSNLLDCLKCSSVCLTCIYNSLNCTQCFGRNRQTPTCLCTANFYELENSTDCVPVCPNTTFQDNINFYCRSCKKGCLTCSTSAQICDTCVELRTLKEGACKCT